MVEYGLLDIWYRCIIITNHLYYIILFCDVFLPLPPIFSYVFCICFLFDYYNILLSTLYSIAILVYYSIVYNIYHGFIICYIYYLVYYFMLIIVKN